MTAPTPPTPPSTAVTPFGQLGLTGLKRSNGYILEEYLPRLMGDKALKTFEEMETSSPTIGAALLAIELLCRQVEWRWEGTDPDTEDPRVEFLEQCWADMEKPWTETLSEILSMLPYGFSYHEIVYKRRIKGGSKFPDNKIGWRGFPIRAQVTRDKWEYGEDGTLLGMWQMAPPDYRRVFIPLEKALHFRPGAHKDNPEGRSVLRRAYRPWYFAKRIEEFEGIGIERDLAGLPVVEVPAELMTATAGSDLAATLEHFKKLVVNLRRDEQEGVVMPQQYDQHGNPMYKLSLLSTGARRQFDTTAILQRYQAQIATTLLADFLMLGHEKVGSYALASSKTSLFSVAIGAWLDLITEVINQQAVPRLLALNGMDTEDVPYLCHGDIETPDLTELADYVSKLTAAGMPLFPDQKIENQLRSYADLPPMTDEEYADRNAMLEEQRQAEAEALREQAGREQADAEAAEGEEARAHEVEMTKMASLLKVPAPDIRVEVGSPEITVMVPKQDPQPAPIVNVAAPEVNVAPSPAPTVNVAAPEVQVHVEAPKMQGGGSLHIKRDKSGKIERMERENTTPMVVKRNKSGQIERIERGDG